MNPVAVFREVLHSPLNPCIVLAGVVVTRVPAAPVFLRMCSDLDASHHSFFTPIVSIYFTGLLTHIAKVGKDIYLSTSGIGLELVHTHMCSEHTSRRCRNSVHTSMRCRPNTECVCYPKSLPTLKQPQMSTKWSSIAFTVAKVFRCFSEALGPYNCS